MTDDEPDVLGEARKNGDHPLLSEKEVAQAIVEARERVRKEQIAEAKKKVIDEEVLRLKREAGKHTGEGVKDELVWVTLDLAEHCDRIVINHEPFYHGFTYHVPRHVANTLREMAARGWIHQDIIDGRDKAQSMMRRRSTSISGRTGVVENAPQAVA